MRLTASLLAAFALVTAGCATAGQAPSPLTQAQTTVLKAKQSLASFTTDDLNAAITAAGKATDAGAPYRARCYATLLKHVPDGQTVGQALPSIKGVVSSFEVAAELDAKVQAGAGGSIVPADVHADCAVIVTSVEQFLIRVDALAAGSAVGLPGAASGLGSVLQGLPAVINAVPKP